MAPHQTLNRSFYLEENVEKIAKLLLGKVISTNINGIFSSGIISETEAYCGENDKACHAYQKRTKRVEVMYGIGGFCYVYLCYGMHPLFNVVTNIKGKADACLIRKIIPLEGVDHMEQRRGKNRKDRAFITGPGTVAKALGITTTHNGIDLLGSTIWVEDRSFTPATIKSSKRIGIDYAGEDKHRLWNFSFYNLNAPDILIS